MLRGLSVRDFVIVDRMELEFAPGFTVLTGETGAGKSILVDALALVLGGRGEAIVVREGAERAEVSAVFEFGADSALVRWLEANDLAGDEGICLVRRTIDRSGRSRGFINGRPATLAQLREAGQWLVSIHGQHEHQLLLDAGAQRDLLDAYGGHADEARSVAEAYRAWQRRRAQRLALERDAAAVQAERERLEWQVQELEALDFSPDGWRALNDEHRRLANMAELIETAQFAVDALSENEAASLPQVNAVMTRLNHAIGHDPRLKDILSMLESAQIQLQEAVYALRHYADRLEVDPQRLREVERRIEAIQAAARRYRVPPENLGEALAAAQARRAELVASGDVDALRRAEEEALAAYMAAAKRLSAARRTTAERLSRQVTQTMQKLAMAGGAFNVAISELAAPTAHGLEQIEFLVSVHKGMAPRPLAKVASGGELSRLSLAIQTVASEVARLPTLIFDEVDAGIGGRVADIVGRMLKELGRRHQVMCITHLPQVAAAADHQWRVTKITADGRALSQVTVLEESERIEEIARMLGGAKITETTRRHAAEMLGLRHPG
jgi:DNA repair protein RecN (Recombination protein N)